MKNANSELINEMGKYLSASSLYLSDTLAKISSMLINKRYDLKMNQKNFANYMGVSQSMVSKWESGDYNFSIESICNICEKLEMSLEINFTDENSYYKKLTKESEKFTINGKNLNIDFSPDFLKILKKAA